MLRCTALVMASLLVAACGGGGDSSEEYGYLYEDPSGDVSESLYGRWGGSLGGSDTRWVLAPDQIILANRCGDTIVGVTAPAHVDETELGFDEDVEDQHGDCFVHARTTPFPACDDDPLTTDTACFAHAGFSLSLYDDTGFPLSLTKLVDE